MKARLNPLRPVDVEKRRHILADYKKHLERARFIKRGQHHHSKRTTPGEVKGTNRDHMNRRSFFKKAA